MTRLSTCVSTSAFFYKQFFEEKLQYSSAPSATTHQRSVYVLEIFFFFVFYLEVIWMVWHPREDWVLAKALHPA
jgi:hypothetical protein